MKIDLNKQITKKLQVSEKGLLRIVDVLDIVYLNCDCYITSIFLINKEKITVSKLLKHFELELSEFGFIRANHSTIVNIVYIKSIDFRKRVLKLKDFEAELKISRRKTYLFKELF